MSGDRQAAATVLLTSRQHSTTALLTGAAPRRGMNVRALGDLQELEALAAGRPVHWYGGPLAADQVIGRLGLGLLEPPDDWLVRHPAEHTGPRHQRLGGGIAATFARRGGRDAEKYTHLVRYQMQPGTRDVLIAAAPGSGDSIEAIRETYDLHLDEIGQRVDFVHLNLEREGLNFGLRPGSVDVFNFRILNMTPTLF